MARQRVKKQHFVSQFYLKQFAQNSKNIFVFDKQDVRAFTANIASVAEEKSFYDLDPASLPTGVSFQIVEHSLAELEGGFSKTLRQVLDALEDQAYLYPTLKHDLAPMIALQSIRTKDFRNAYSESMVALASAVGRDQLRKKGIDEDFCIQPSEEFLKLSQSQMMFGDLVRKITAAIRPLIWFVCRSSAVQPFFSSDAPVVRKAHIYDQYLRHSGYESPGIEVCFPLSPKYLLCMVDRIVHRVQEKHELQVIDVTPDNVTYYNSLQVYQCSRYLYSNSDSFDLPRQMIAAEPIIREPRQHVEVVQN